MGLGACLGALFVLPPVAAYFRYAPRPARPDSSKKRVACIGDSITFSSGVMRHRKRDAWVFLLGRALGPAWQAINYGVSGTTLQQEGDKPYRKHGFLKRVVQDRPAVVVLMLGTNDTKPQNWSESRFAAQYRELVQEILEYPWPHRLLLLAPPCAFAQPKTGQVGFSIRNEFLQNQVHTTVQQTAEAFGLPWLDLYRLTEDHPEYFADEVHPNALGNRKIAALVYETICRLESAEQASGPMPGQGEKAPEQPAHSR